VEVGQLLAREVVVEAVQDEDRDERQRQGDDPDEGHGQAALERAWQDPPDRPGQAMRRRRGGGTGVTGVAAGAATGAGTAGSALGEGVPDTSHRQDERGIGRVVLDLLAQVADVDVDRLLVLVERLVVAQQLEQLAAGVDAARAAGEVAQDLELGRGQADPAGAALDAPALEVDDQVAMADDPPAAGVGELAVERRRGP
jgi:hypothetical protein